MQTPRNPRPWLGITFQCCQVYGRAYKDGVRNEYRAQCPKCGRWAIFPVGKGGNPSRFFEVG